MRTRGLLILALLLGVLWVLPSVLVRFVLPQMAGPGMLELEGVRPVLPIGVRVERAVVNLQEPPLEIREASVTWSGRKLRAAASLAGGTVRINASGLGGSGVLLFEDLMLGELNLELPVDGRAHGRLRWGKREEGTASVSNGQLRSPALGGIGVPFNMVAVEWFSVGPDIREISTVQVYGSGIALDGTGRVGPNEELDLDLRVRQLAPSTQQLLLSLGLDVPPAPFEVAVSGTLEAPAIQLK